MVIVLKVSFSFPAFNVFSPRLLESPEIIVVHYWNDCFSGCVCGVR